MTAQSASGMTPTEELAGWLSGIGSITRTIGRTETLESVLNHIAEVACRLTKFDFCAVQMTSEDHKRLEIVGSYGLTSDYIDHVNTDRPISLAHRREFLSSPSSRAHRSQLPVLIRDTRTDPSFGPWEAIASDQGYRALLALPLESASGPVGVLALYSVEPVDVTESAIEVAATFAHYAAIALDVADLRARERRAYVELERTNAALEERQGILDRAAQIHADLTEVTLSGGGLDKLSEALAALVHAPIKIRDSDGLDLAEVRRGSLSVPPTAVPPQPQRQPNASKVELLADEMCLWHEPVVVGQRIEGTITAGPTPRPLEGLEVQALQIAALAVAIDLVQRKAASEAVWRETADLLDDILAGDLIEDRIRRTATRLGHDLTVPHRCLAISCGSQVLAKRVLALANRLASQYSPGPLVSQRELTVLAFVPEGDDSHDEGLRYADQMRRQVVTAGIQGVVLVAGTRVQPTDFTEVASTTQAVAELTVATEPLTVINADEQGPLWLLLHTRNPAQSRDFSRQILGPLQVSDGRPSSNLVETMRTYLANDCSPTRTATALNVHVNTVNYRLRRIGRLTGLRTDTLADQFSFQLALMVDDLDRKARPTAG